MVLFIKIDCVGVENGCSSSGSLEAEQPGPGEGGWQSQCASELQGVRGGSFTMGNTGTPMANSCQCMAKTTTIL